jgi:hypothetical protein
MWNVPMKERLDKIPRLYETEEIGVDDKLIYLHFFFGGCDWFAAEYDGDDIFFGFAILNGDMQNAEWGYFSFSELKELRIDWMEIDCELEEYWQIKPAGKIPIIAKVQKLKNGGRDDL